MSLLSVFGVLSAVALAAIASPLPASNATLLIERQVGRVDSQAVQTFKYYSEYTAAAYCGGQKAGSGKKITCGWFATCPMLEGSNTKVLHTWASPAEGNSGATGFVAVDHTKRAVVLSMRGSVNMQNWISDVKYFTTDCSRTVAIPGAACAIGFDNFWQDSKKAGGMEHLVRAAKQYPDYTPVVTGHSLGGAAAVIGGAEIQQVLPKTKVYTYGQPRVGNKKLSEGLTARKFIYRITHTDDIVPQLPWESSDALVCPGCTPFYHVSPEYHIKSGLGNDASKYQVLQGIANYQGNAANSFMPDFIAHIQYYQVNMYSCALPIDPLVNIIGWGKGTWAQTPATPGEPQTIVSYDQDLTLTDLVNAGTPADQIDKLKVRPPPGAKLPGSSMKF